MTEATDKELIAWVASVIERERQRETNGHVKVEMHEGRVQRVRVESVEKPGGA